MFSLLAGGARGVEKLAHTRRETVQIQSSFGTSPAEREACAEPIKEGKKNQWIFFSISLWRATED